MVQLVHFTRQQKLNLLIGVTLVAVVGVFCLQRIPQPQSYHRFADKRSLFDVSNFANVVSNLPFLWTGGLGLWWLGRFKGLMTVKTTYGILFVAIIGIAFGSGYYHLFPDNDRLVFDRLPMTTVFMALLTAVVMEFISVQLGKILVLPLVFIGIFSVYWWIYTEHHGRGDLRLYGLVQFYPMVCIPLIIGLFYQPGLKWPVRALIFMVGWYAIAKVAETFDGPIYRLLSISGHTLKHLAAAFSTYYLVQFFVRLHILQRPA